MSCRVTAAGRTILVDTGARLSAALNQAGIFVETPCGSRGYCRKCVVRVEEPEPPAPTPPDLEMLTRAQLGAGYRLSCQLTVTGDLTIAILPAAAADLRKVELGRLAGAAEIDPRVELPPDGSRVVGLALDVGTTSLAGALLDLRTGEELAAHVAANPQSIHGADLMSRLAYATCGPGQAAELQALATDAARALLAHLCCRAGVEPGQVAVGTLVGNTAMHHLFLGLPVEGLALAPYTPARVQACEARLPGLPSLYVLPNVAGFVGADAVAAALATGLDETGGTVLLVDIGTNGEMLLAHRGEIFACSAPAGPAFEGGELSQGLRAGPGAIEAVTWDGDDLHVGVIQGAPARGICGSGLLDGAAALLAGGLLDRSGRLQACGPAARRVQPGGTSVELAPGVALTQKDIRALQLAKGAIRSGIDLLLRAAGIGPEALDEILLAGAFGNYLRRESAIAVGLLPPVAPEKVRPVGNAAAAGAKLALLSRRAGERAEQLAGRVRMVELATHPDFEAIFMEALDFPSRAGG